VQCKNYLIAGLFVLGLSATIVFSGISGSAHDFSSTNWASGKVCAPCHAPHNTNLAVGYLWNRELSTGPWEVREGAELGAASIMCLSCHDGSIALDSFGGNTGSEFISGPANVGLDLRGDHPVGVGYPLEGRYVDKVTVVASGLKLYAGANGDQVECASCHDVHNSTGYEKLMRVPNNMSALCLACHDM
jgi:predicted CXXCH cytochrome family protein